MLRVITSLVVMLSVLLPIQCQLIFGRRSQASACENPIAGKQYVRDQSSNLCFLVGTQGPCNEMMIFYQNPSPRLSNYGFCDCDQGLKSDQPCKDAPIRKRLYVPSEGRCYTVFSQGPCHDGQWLVYDETKKAPRCVPNHCQTQKLSSPTSNHFWYYDPKRRQCYKTLSQGHCPSGFTLELIHTSEYPVCKRVECFSSLAHGIRSALRCQTGSRVSYLTRDCTLINRRKSSKIG